MKTMKTMKTNKFYISIIILLFTCHLSHAQCGFSGTTIYLRTQTDVDNFISNWCTDFQGSLYIEDNNDGIDNITNVDALAGLSNVGQKLIFYQNYNLTSLAGLSSLVTVGERFNIRENPLIADLIGLSSLQTVGGFLGISETLNMTSLQGLENLTSIGWNLAIFDNASLQNLDAVSSLTFVAQGVTIAFNPLLTDISGIQNIDPIGMQYPYNSDELKLYNNPLLSVCENQFVCDFLALATTDPNLNTFIQNNAPDCNSETEVDEACNACPQPITTTPAEIFVCHDFSGSDQGQYMMQDADDLIRTDASHVVLYFENLALTTSIDATSDYTVTDATIVYAVVNDGTCDSDPVEVSFEVSYTNYNTLITEQPNCGLDNGSIYIAGAFGGVAPYTYSIDGINFSIFNAYGPLAPGTYYPQAKDANGCLSYSVISLLEDSDPLVVVPAPVATTCNMDNGSVSFTTTTGTDPVTYTENGQSVSMTDLAPGTYTWDAEDAGGCMSQVSFIIDDSEILSITPSITHTTCNLSNGVISMAVNTGTEPVTYRVNGIIIILDSPVWSPGTYTVDAEDANGCLSSFDVTIDPSDELDITPSTTATTCDLDNGEVSFVVNTGTAPITYSENGSPITDFTGLAAGIHSWEAEDAIGCLFTVDFTIDPSIAASFTTTPTSTFCDGNNGSVSATMITGNGSLTYTLNGVVNNTGVYTNLAPGTYTMTAVDSDFCTASSTFTINGSDPLEITTVVTPTFCNEDNGSIIATLNSGTAPVDYTIAGQGTNTTGTFTDLAPGTYTMDAVDAVGCEATEIFTIAPSDPLDINTVIVHTTCELDNGSVTATLTSGTTPVTFTIAGVGSNTAGVFSDLLPGSYTMNAEDAVGCEATVSFMIDDSTLPLFAMETIRTSCGDMNGSIRLTPDVTTGRAPYQFNIGAGWTADYIFDNLDPGTYTVTIRDADDCMTSQETTILDSEQLEFIYHVDDAECGNLNGIVTLVATAGISPMTYTLKNEYISFENTSGIFANLEAGIYSGSVLGSDLCEVIQEIEVLDLIGVQLVYKEHHPDCGESDGEIEFDFATNGTPPFRLYMDNQLIQDSLYYGYSITELGNGDYPVIVRDAIGCEDSAVITLDDGNSILSGQIIDNIDCDGTLGSITSFISDDGSYTFTLDSVTNATGDYSNLTSGVYNFYMTDSMGCDLDQEITIDDHSFSGIRPLARLNDCGDMFDLRIFNRGGQAPFSYFLNGVEYFTSIISNLPVGDYEIISIDDNGCEASEFISMEGNNVLDYEITQCQMPNKAEGGFLRINPIGGVGPYEFKLGQFFNGSGLFINLEETEYELTITDDRGCFLNTVITLCPADEEMKISSRNQKDFDFTIYPNPGNNEINITVFPLTTTVEIYNNLGKKVLSTEVQENTNSLRVDVSKFHNGVYYIRLDNNDSYKKWIKI